MMRSAATLPLRADVLLVLIVATMFGVTNLLGFLGSKLADTMNYVSTVAQEGQPVETQEAFDTIRDGAWGTLIVVIIALCAAALGGLLGSNEDAT